MKEILEDTYVNYTTISIKQNHPILGHLIKENYPFRLQQVSHKQFLELQNAKFKKKVYVPYENFIAGFSHVKGNSFRSSGGLKVSDPEGKIRGSFVIDAKKVIYDATIPFYEERDACVYSGKRFFTEMSMIDILRDDLRKQRTYLIYIGEQRERLQYKPIFEEVNKEEFLEYAIYPEKGEEVFSRIRRF